MCHRTSLNSFSFKAFFWERKIIMETFPEKKKSCKLWGLVFQYLLAFLVKNLCLCFLICLVDWAIITMLNIGGAFHHLLLLPTEVVNKPIKSSLWRSEQLKLYSAWSQDPFLVAPCWGRYLSICLHFLPLHVWLYGARLLSTEMVFTLYQKLVLPISFFNFFVNLACLVYVITLYIKIIYIIF